MPRYTAEQINEQIRRFSITLDTLAEYLGTRTVVLTEMAANICVPFTANDACKRDLRVVVPADCVASNRGAENDHAPKAARTSTTSVPRARPAERSAKGRS